MSVTITVTECIGSNQFVLYGDESTSRELVTYCLIAVPVEMNTRLQQQMIDVFKKHGGTDESRFHCREIFSKQARDKSTWAHLNEEQSWDLARDLASVAKANGAICSLGVVHRNTYPQFLPDGKGGEFEIKAETCYSFGFISAAAGLTMKEYGPGPGAKYILFVDPQNTRFNLFGIKTSKLEEMIATTGLRPEKIDFKPLPIDLADLVAYCSARALSEYEYRNKTISIEVYEKTVVPIVDYWWSINRENQSEGIGLRREGRKVVFYPVDLQPPPETV